MDKRAGPVAGILLERGEILLTRMAILFRHHCIRDIEIINNTRGGIVILIQ